MRHRRLALSVAALTTVLTAGAVSLPLTPAHAGTDANQALMVYEGYANPTGVAKFGTWLGRPVNRALDFYPGDSWSAMENPGSLLTSWAGHGLDMEFSMGMWPTRDGISYSLSAGASGAYNGHWTNVAKSLVAAGWGSAKLRIGFEFNGSWMPWNALNGKGGDFAAYWRQIVNTMRAVPGANFKFDWCFTRGYGSGADTVITAAYPGDAYVDYIGADAYDQSPVSLSSGQAARWNEIVTSTAGLQFQANFASSHGKQISYPEWGLAQTSAQGGGDNPYYIQAMHDWIANHNVAYASYFDVNADTWPKISTGQYPNAAQTFIKDFGPNGTTSTTAAPTTTTAPPTTTTAPPSTTSTTAPPSTTTTTAPPSTTTTVPQSVGTPIASTPATPTNFSVTVSGTSVTLKWVNGASTDGDNIYRNGVKVAWPGWPNPVVQTWTDKSLNPGTSYTYAVSAYNGNGESARTKGLTVTITTQSTSGTGATGAPAIPTAVTGTLSGNTVVVTWVNGANTGGNDVYRNGVKVAWPGWPDPVVQTWTNSGLASGKYTYRVSAYNGYGESAQSIAVSFTV